MAAEDEQEPMYSDAFQAWLMGLGPNPYDLTERDVYGFYDNYAPPSDLDDLGTQELQNKNLTAGKKGLSMGVDPAFMYELGRGPGGWSQEQFGYDSEFIPVQAPGFSALNYHSQGDDPLMNYVAEQFATGAGALAIETKLKDTIKKGGDPGRAVQAMIPTADDKDGNEYLDWKRLGTILTAIETDIVNDPQFNSFDPETGLPAYEKKTARPGQEFIDRTGQPSPYEMYDPDLLARAGSLEREAGTRDEFTQQMGELQTAAAARQQQMAMMKASLESGGTGTYDVPRPEGYQMPSGPASLGDRPSAEGDQGPQSGATKAWWGAQNAANAAMGGLDAARGAAGDFINDPAMGQAIVDWFSKPDGEAEAAEPAIEAQKLQDFSTADRIARIQALNGAAPRGQGGDYGRRTRSTASPDEQRSWRRGQEARRETHQAARGAARSASEAYERQMDDEYAQLERQRMMSYLDSQGYNPFDQAQRARQGSVWGR